MCIVSKDVCKFCTPVRSKSHTYFSEKAEGNKVVLNFLRNFDRIGLLLDRQVNKYRNTALYFGMFFSLLRRPSSQKNFISNKTNLKNIYTWSILEVRNVIKYQGQADSRPSYHFQFSKIPYLGGIVQSEQSCIIKTGIS